MTAIRIDFAPPSLRRTLHRTPLAHWLLALAALACCAGAAWGIAARLEQQHARAALLLRAAAVRTPAATTAPRAPIPAALAAAVNGAVLQLNLPWRELQDAIEAATPASVALLALEPDPKTRTLRVTAEAKASDAMLNYVERLKQQPFFTGATLTGHDTNEQDANRPLRFQIEAQWSAPGTAP